jgi:uncharacterized membrane protein YkoI
MKITFATSIVAFAIAVVGAAGGGSEKIPLDKIPQPIVDAVKMKFPKAELKHANKETEAGKVVYEIGLDVDKVHMHAMVTAEGKLYAIHRDVDPKAVPDKAAKAVRAKYPKASWEAVEEITDADGKVTAYEVSVGAGEGRVIEVTVDLSGKILKELTIDPKKDGK